jgi:tRNA(Ile)-lysidine synthase
MKHRLSNHVQNFLTSRLAAHARVCLGYSGGLDSSVLLHLLTGLRQPMGFTLTAVHIHHGLSVNADAWAAHCQTCCDQLGVPLSVRRVTLRPDGHGLEDAARVARQRIYAEQQAEYLILAHHLDDQAETLLFRLLRGAGVQGLSAMAEQSRLADKIVLRPLLSVSRADLLAYAMATGTTWIDDESNTDQTLTRNWLRHSVFPLLETRFPASRTLLARTAAQMAESAALLEELAREDLIRVAEGEGLRLDRLSQLSAARARNLLRYWLRRECGLSPGRAWTDEALRQLLQARPDHHPELVLGDWYLRRKGGLVVLVQTA